VSSRRPVQLFTEVASDSISLQTGLMHRRKLPWKSGMLFVFPSEGKHGFWMQNTHIPLDIAFITADLKIAEIHSMVPMSTSAVRPSVPCKYVLEVNKGWFERNKITVGSRIGGSIYREAQSADAPEVALVQGFRDAVQYASANKLEMRIQYMYSDTGKVIDYVFIPVGEYMFYTSRDGTDLVVAPCKHSSGEYRQFNVDNVIDFNLFIPPEEAGHATPHPTQENAGKEVAVPPVEPFNNGMGPQDMNVVEFPAPGRAARSVKKVVREAQEAAGGSDSAMMTDYWAEIDKKKKRGLTDGEAIMEFLEEKSSVSKKRPKKKSES